MTCKNSTAFLLLILLTFSSEGQSLFSRKDSLRGMLSPARSCYDVLFYDLNLQIDFSSRKIKGSNKISYSVVEDFQKIQIDLFSNMLIDSVLAGNRKLKYVRDSNAIIIYFPEKQNKGSKDLIEVFYSGAPVAAKNPPWDGGFVWASDSLQRPWVAVACEGLGASSWWPCKDHPSDEPDSMRMTYTVPSGLSCIANGNLHSQTELLSGHTSFSWFVSYPINTYNVTLNIGKYEHFNDTYAREDGSALLLDYYVLDYHLSRAKAHFVQVEKILKSYEKFFGPYPFPDDGYALIETPYWGMEHQSAISYGNNFVNKLGDFDFIIVHETAHEWWGNSLTASDMGDLWIHEAFATYAESLLMEDHYGNSNAINYLKNQRKLIKNKQPMLKPRDVAYFHSQDSDIYFKGAWMLHSIRNTIGNDSLFFNIIHGLANNHKHSVLNTEAVINYFNLRSAIDLGPVFEQYLKYLSPPTLLYKIKKKGPNLVLSYKWKADVKDFNMPVIIELNNKKRIKLAPSTSFQNTVIPGSEAENFRVVSELFYIQTEPLKGSR